ncbi:MAG TPA: hypothetical protein VF329_00130 [Gammaproteobacteria bacterium]
MRIPFFVLAVLSIVLVVAVELATLALLRNAAGMPESLPGLGGPYLALLDGILLYFVVVTSLGYFRFKAQVAKAAAVAGLILSLVGVVVSFLLIVAAFLAIMLMLGLLFAAPFGTLAYLDLFANFPKQRAIEALSFIMLLKVFFLFMLALTDLGYLKNKLLVILIGLSMLATWLTSMLIAWPPGFLSSITDAVGALVTAVIAFVWLIVTLVASILGIARLFDLQLSRREV